MKFEASPGDKIKVKITAPGKAPRVIKMTVGDNVATHTDNRGKWQSTREVRRSSPAQKT